MALRATQGGVVRVQVRNEFVSVAVTTEVHDRALDLIERHGLSVYDALIVAAALGAGCKTLWAEDMQDGRCVDDCLTLRNPFRKSH